MRVNFYLADQNPHRDRSRGITQYTSGLLRELRLRDGIEVSCLVSRSSYRPTGDGIETRVLPFRTDHVIGRLVADQFQPLLNGTKAHIWHFPKGFCSHVVRPRAPAVGTVHDTILDFYAERYPRSRSRAAFVYWRALLARSLARFDLVLTISQFSKRSIEAFCERRGMLCPPITVTYEGGSWEELAGQVLPKSDCVVHLCSHQPHKRTNTMLRFWEILAQRRESLPLLRLIGNTTREQDRWIGRLSHVERLGPLSSEDLRCCIEMARAIIIPSEVEGFGLPALEAYYLGTPAVYVRDTAVEEVLGRSTPGGFDLESVESFRAALEAVLALDPGWIREKGVELSARFSWNACVDRTLAAYRKVT